MGKLSDILNGGFGNFNDTWAATAAADDFGPLPRGSYVCHVNGELKRSSKGTPGFGLTFTIIEGTFARRKLWHDLWLSDLALPATKRDLAKLKILSPADMEKPLPRWFRCRVVVVIRRDDFGIEKNEVKGFTVEGFDTPTADPFAPKEPGGNDAGPPLREPGEEPNASFDPTQF